MLPVEANHITDNEEGLMGPGSPIGFCYYSTLPRCTFGLLITGTPKDMLLCPFFHWNRTAFGSNFNVHYLSGARPSVRADR